MPDTDILLSIVNLTKTFARKGRSYSQHNDRHLMVVKNVTFDIRRGECLALIGESGSGKTSLARCLLRLTSVNDGHVLHNGLDLLKLPEKEFRLLRPKFQIVFQESAQALNPRQSVRECLAEPVKVHFGYQGQVLKDEVSNLLALVGLKSELALRFPHELSGGQRQRVAIARALATRPEFLVADEPTSSLDASLKLRIIELLQDLQRRLNLTLMLISHDLAVVFRASDHIAVMYKGNIVEMAPTRELVRQPLHPYSRILVESAHSGFSTLFFPEPAEYAGNFEDDRPGCDFSDRCPFAEEACRVSRPLLQQVSERRSVACHLVEKKSSAFQFEEHHSIPC